ncbi:MAG TPA: ATP-binding protein [Streptosporangiaceae bacterium]
MLLPTYAPMKSSPFRSPAGGIWSDLYMIAESSAVSQARRFTEAYLRRRRLTPLTDTATLVTSELVTNAVRATGTLPSPPVDAGGAGQAVVGLRLRLSPAGLFVEVWDRDPRPPVLAQAGAFDEGGRGLALVDAFSKAWDHYPCAGTTPGKVVWAEISLGTVTS